MNPYQQLVHDISGKKILILGLGLLGGGSAVARFLYEAGGRIKVTDQKNASELAPSLQSLENCQGIEYVLGGHNDNDIDWADIIVRNPSVPWHHPLLERARLKHKTIVMETQMFVQYAHIPTIGVTGTRGKTTTTMMIDKLIKTHTSKQVILGGNLAHHPVLPQLKNISDTNNTLALLELSSWQLQAFHQHHLSVNYAVITNLYQDHLNYYTSLDEYYQDKTAIFAYQHSDDVVSLNRLQPEFLSWSKHAPGKIVWFETNDIPETVVLAVPGEHNRLNAAAALSIAPPLGINPSDGLQTLTTFAGVPYRLQTIKVKDGITIINDTTSTSPVATITALECVNKPVALILGGFSAHLPVKELAEAINREAAGIYLLSGSGTEEIKPYLNPHHIRLETTHLPEAVRAALQEPGIKTLLFSPGFKSFGLFKNEFDRGDQFNKIVHEL